MRTSQTVVLMPRLVKVSAASLEAVSILPTANMQILPSWEGLPEPAAEAPAESATELLTSVAISGWLTSNTPSLITRLARRPLPISVSSTWGAAVFDHRIATGPDSISKASSNIT